jgi:gliding motility-associated-like protein
MKRLLLLIISICAPLLLTAQPTEICNNGIDDDFDGFIDCYDGSCSTSSLCDGLFLGNDAACQVPPAQFPLFTMTLDFASPDETTNHLSRLAIGDLDRDGMPEIVTMNRYTKKVFILNGNDGSIKHEATVDFEPYWEVAIANIDDDNCGEIYFMGYKDYPNANNASDGTYFFAFDCALNPLWQSAQKLRGDPINYGLADFDGDGLVELYAKDEIFDAKTGVRIVKSTAASYTRINGGPVAVNVLGDIKLELVLGLNIYQVNLGSRTADAGSLTLLQGRNDYFIRNEYNATSVADYNQDGFLDVLASGSTTAHGLNTTVFFWDVQNNTIKTYADPQPALGNDYKFGWKNGTGRLNIADLDGNGTMNASFVSGRFLYALDQNFNLLWRANINEETSGHTGCTLFDFNGDGKSEIVYRDEQYVYIINGTDGTNYQNPQRCISRTNREYPIVADLDADGSTEICVTCGFDDVSSWTNFNNLNYSRYSHVRVFKSASEPWVPARRVWNQHGYYVVNVNDDLTIPTAIQAHQLIWSTGNCTQGPNRPLNKFLNQAPFLNSEGCPTYAAPNLTFTATDPIVDQPTCPDLDFTISMEITNAGDVSLTGNFPISFYTSNPRKGGATKLNTVNIPVNDFKPNTVLALTDIVVNGIGSDSLYIVLNDAGTTVPTPISLPNANFVECSFTDNIIGVRIIPKPVSITALAVSPNDQCEPTTGSVRAFVPVPAGTENTTDYNFYWSNGAIGKPIASADFVGAINSGIPDGPYTVYARHKTANCSSDTATVNVALISTAPDVSIHILSQQTVCNPPDGQLQAAVVGGNAGYTFEWYDGNLNPLLISGPTAQNLTAGNYIVIATKNGCNDVSAPVTISGPAGPDAQAQTLQNVVDCINPNSGSVSAQATISGIPQNPSNYTFDWYFYDNTTNTRGSILPPVHGTGPTRTGLAVGFYQIVITDNATQCTSSQTPTVQVSSLTNLPTVQILEGASQTSCDPSQPNGILTATATATGLTSPNDFTFEWFKGDNTLPANLVTTVSGLKGETVNQVAGGGVFYTVKATTPNNCSATAKYTISENVVAPVVTLSSTPNSVCDINKATSPYNGTITATVTFNGPNIPLPDNNYTFTWHKGPSVSDPTIVVTDAENPVLSGLQDGTYAVTVNRNDLHCVSNPVTRVVAKATVLPALSTTSTGSNNCDALLTPDGTATVAVTNTVIGDVFQYQWYNGNSVSIGQELSTVNNGQQSTAIKLGGPVGAPKPYTVYVLNQTTGCENSAIQAVADVSSVPVLSLGAIIPNRICSPATSFNGEINVIVNNIPTSYTIADYTFIWKDAVPAVIPGFTSTRLDKRDAGTYTAQAFNTKTGCNSAPITSQVPNAKVLPAIQIATTGSHNCDPLITGDGTATATISNTVAGETFTFVWAAVAPTIAITNATNNANQATAIKLGGPTNAPNSYQVTVTNNSTGCVNSNMGMVADNSQKPTLVLQPFDNSICDKTLVTVGSAQYNGRVDITSVNDNVGSYTGTITSTYQWFDVNPMTSALTANTTSPTNTTASLTQLDNGKYAASVTITELGCTSNPVIAEVLDNQPTVTITTQVAASTNCAPARPGNGSAQVTFVNGTAVGATTDYSYEWYNGATVSGSIIGASALLGANLQGTNTFTVRATNKTNGCRGNVPVTVSDAKVTPTISVSLVQNNTVCDITTLNPTGELQATVNAGINFSINWTGGVAPSAVAGTNGERFINLKAGSYSASVTNNDTGCQSTTSSQSVLDNLTYPVIAVGVTPQSSCGVPNGRLDATADATTNTALYNFDWFDGAGTGTPHATGQVSPGAINLLASADYTIRVKQISTGCTSTQTRTVPNNVVIPTLSMIGVNAVTSCNASVNGQATVSITGLSAPTNYDIYYVYTPDSKGGVAPTDPADIKTAVDPTKHTYTNLLNQSAVPTAYANMAPGFLTALIIDKNTSCEASPKSQQIIDNTTKSTISVNIVPSPGICSAGNGGLDATVNSVPPMAPTAFTYDWYVGTPNNAGTINFFDNPPTFSTGSIYVDHTVNRRNLGKNSIPMDNTIGPGPYTLVVRDPLTGCGAYVTTTVTTGTSPVIATSIVDVTDCSSGNGQIQAIVTSGLSPAGYSIEVYEGNSKVGAPIFTSGGLRPVNTVVTATPLPAGPYFIEIIDGNHPTCPMGRGIVLTQQVYPPVITVNNIVANTSCTPDVSADGKVQLTVANNASDTQAKSYYISNISPLPVGFVLNPSPGNIIGTGASGQTTGMMNGFQSITTVPNYTITVTDDLGNCSTDVVVAVPEQQSLPSDLNLSVTPETLCAPSSNGSGLVTLVGGEPTTQFNFSWSSTNTMSAVVFGPTAGAGGTAGELLNQSKVIPANWTMGLTGTGSGERKFYVQGVKNAAAPSGVGCKTAIKEVIIPDQHVSPDLTLSSLINSYCLSTSANALVGDGSITIAADADPNTVGQQNATGGFNYVWTNANAALVSPQMGQSNNYLIPQLGTGSYQVTATNATNHCNVVRSVNVDAAPYTVSVVANTLVDQRICLSDGDITITQISIQDGNGTNILSESNAALNTKYTFLWYKANPATPGTFNSASGQELADFASTDITGRTLGTDIDQIAEPGEYQAMSAGTYYVIANRSDNSAIGFGCTSLPYRVDVQDIHQNPAPQLQALSNTSCLPGIDEGEIKISVSDNTNTVFKPIAGFTYQYTWSGPGLIPGVNPGSGNGNALSTDGDNDHYQNLADNINPYTVTVLNNQTGCSAVATATIIKNATPVFVQDVQVGNQNICAPDGSLTVTEVTLNDRAGNSQTFNTSSAPSINDFDFDWSRSASGFTQTTSGATPPANVLNVGNYNSVGFGIPMGFDTYTVVATRRTGSPGAGCPSAPFNVEIKDNRIYPVATLVPFANTSCSLNPALAEGEITVRINDASGVSGPFNYSYAWDNINNPTSIATVAIGSNEGDNFGGGELQGGVPDNDEDHPTGLFHGTYAITVTNNQTQCSSTASTTLFQNSTPVFTQAVIPSDQVLCFPDGSLTVNEVKLIDRNGTIQSNLNGDFPLTDFQFSYDRGTVGNTVVSISASPLLNSGNYPAIGFDSYYVMATRIAGSPGLDCPSAPFKVDILDKRLFPKVDFTSIPNSSCNPALSNGTVVVNASEQTGANTETYNFAWSFSGNPVVPGTFTNNSSTVTAAMDGSYSITATNTTTNCPINGTFDLQLDQTRSTPNIIDVTGIDPFDCNPSGQAEVTKITLGSTSSSILIPPGPTHEVTGAGLLNYAFEWYRGGTTPADKLTFTTPCIGPGCGTPTAGLLPGSYFVTVQDPTTDCISGPREVMISDGNVINPVVSIVQTAKQIICGTTTGSGQLVATAIEENGTTGTYDFEWFPSLDLTGTAIAPVSVTNPSAISSLLTGNYSVRVLNTSTNCVSSALFIVPDESILYTPVLSFSGQPRTQCVGQDGELSVKVINLDSGYPFPISLTADLYVGSNPDLNGPPDASNLPGYLGSPISFVKAGLAEGIYTVRIRDNNTNCEITGEFNVEDHRVYPTPSVAEISPNTNCEPFEANGVATVSVNGSFAEYDFNWYEGNAPAGSIVYTGAEYNKLKPILYTVEAVDTRSGCPGTVQTTIINGTLPIPIPFIDKLSDVTSCITANGSLTAYVGLEKNTADYIFNWYNGTTETPPSDFVGEIYSELAVGTYSVTATSRITGCKSPLVDEDVIENQILPDLDVIAKNSSCSKNDGSIVLLVNSNVPIQKIEWEDDNGPISVGPNLMEITSGTYTAIVTSNMGCVVRKDVSIIADIRPYNGISRNNDTQNEFFKIDCIEDYPDNVVKIYNRVGTLVYEGHSYDNTNIFFDGKSNKGVSPFGTNLPDGTYFFTIDKSDGSKPLSGYLEIVN